MPGGQPLHKALLLGQAAQDLGGQPGAHSGHPGDPEKPAGGSLQLHTTDQVTGGGFGWRGGEERGEGELSTLIPQVLAWPKKSIEAAPLISANECGVDLGALTPLPADQR